MKDLNEVFEMINEEPEDNFYGIRSQEVEFDEEGDIMIHTSHVWVDEEDLEEELDGVCALHLAEYNSMDAALEAVRIYPGGHVAIIAGNYATYGEDINEIIIRDPTVICVIS